MNTHYSNRAGLRVSTGKEPQVPPLRFAPVGMTMLLCPQDLQELTFGPHDSIVIPTGGS
jgi:hypothetical protein